VQQYVKLHDWTQPADKPVVLSGSPQRDAAAYEAAEEQLTEADWRILEKIAPRSIWDRIEQAHKKSDAAADVTAPSSRGAAPTTQQSIIEGPARRSSGSLVTVDKLPDGKVRIFYELQYFGASVSSARDGGTSRRNIVLTQADLKPLVDLLAAQLDNVGSVTALSSENKIIITCQAGAEDHIIKLLDKVDTPARQAEITARIFEVSHDFDFQLGAQALIKHISSDSKQALASAFSAKAFAESITDPVLGKVPDPGSALRLMQVFGNSGLSLDVTFQALADTGLINVVSSPRMTVSAGQTAYMLAGQELPITSATIANDRIISQQLTYKPIGVQLYITPQIIGESDVKLHVITMVSAVSGFAPLPKMGTETLADALVNPIIDSREAETYVTIAHGSTLVIGGLRMIRTVTREAKVPGLGDLETLEWLFKTHRSQKLVNDLYFFVTPRIIS
jgi:type II secretory pathway component GspD/PulD (secretin)